MPLLPLKTYLYAGVGVAVAGLGIYIYTQNMRIESYKKDIAALEQDKQVCLSANADTMATIASLKSERDRSITSCSARLSKKDDVIKGLQNIIAAGGHNAGTATVIANAGVSAIIGILDGMLPEPSGSEDGIHSSPSTTSTTGATVSSGFVGYCLDEVNAKNMAANIIMLRGWAFDMQTALISLQTGS